MSDQSTFQAEIPTPGVDVASWFEFAPLPANTENLTKRSFEWKEQSSPFDGEQSYERFFRNLARNLFRSSPRHVIIRREKGVGDRAALLEFARVANDGRFVHLKDKQICRIDCRYVQPHDNRNFLNIVFESLSRRPDIVVCLDSIGVFLSVHDQFQTRSLLLSLLANTPCRLIGVVDEREFNEHLSGRSDAEELFTYLDLHEPSVEAAEKIVEHFANGLREKHRIDIGEKVIHGTVRLTDSYIPSSRLPMKAVRLLSEICDDLAFGRMQGETDRQSIILDDVVERVSEISGVPTTTLVGMPDTVDYRVALQSRIVGQESVVKEVATELGLIKAGMVDSGKPASVMLFVGQTGTGKTELAKVVAKLYSASKKLKTITLGNFSEPHSVSGIIGVPAGYVGHENGGRLINELNSDPYGVFLLDEADKAHPDVMQPFLNLFDEGWIVDQRGIKAYADRAIFILTTNIGQRQIAEMLKKGKSWDEIHSKIRESLSQIRHAKANRPVFSAEFLARIKRVIIFEPLDHDAMRGISKLICEELTEKWSKERQKKLVISSAVMDMIAKVSHDQNESSKNKEGGRIVRKSIADLVETALRTAIASSPEMYQSKSTILVSSSTENTPGVVVSFE